MRFHPTLLSFLLCLLLPLHAEGRGHLDVQALVREGGLVAAIKHHGQAVFSVLTQ